MIRVITRAAVLVTCALLLAACEEDQSTLAPASDQTEQIASLWWVLFAVSAVVVGVIGLLVLAAALRRGGRARRTPDAGDPLLGRVLILAGGVAVPLVVLVVLFTLTVRTLPAVSATPAEGELTIEVEGRQWFWDVRYPGLGVRTANEIHVPVGQSVRIEATSADVVHSFWVPRLARKIDMIPGRTNSIVFEADRAGVYRGQCAEFCGLQHANMAFLVIAEPPAEFEDWAERQAQPAADREGGGLDTFLERGCAGCHTIAGTPAEGELGPDLTHVASRRTLAAATIPNTPGRLAGWILDPQHVKPGNRMPGLPLADDELLALVNYLDSLD